MLARRSGGARSRKESEAAGLVQLHFSDSTDARESRPQRRLPRTPLPQTRQITQVDPGSAFLAGPAEGQSQDTIRGLRAIARSPTKLAQPAAPWPTQTRDVPPFGQLLERR